MAEPISRRLQRDSHPSHSFGLLGPGVTPVTLEKAQFLLGIAIFARFRKSSWFTIAMLVSLSIRMHASYLETIEKADSLAFRYSFVKTGKNEGLIAEKNEMNVNNTFKLAPDTQHCRITL